MSSGPDLCPEGGPTAVFFWYSLYSIYGAKFAAAELVSHSI